MWCPSPSSGWSTLSQHLGAGHLHPAGTLRLTTGQLGGSGLIWSLTVAGQRCQAWCEEQAWCQWIAPVLPVPGLASIDPALLTPLALWSWQPLMRCLAEDSGGEAQLQIKPPTPGTLSAAWDPQLILTREDKVQLALRLLDWPTQWLIDLSQAWKPLASGHRVPPLAISVVAGWCWVSDQALEKIGLGEGLRLSGAVDLWHGEAWLFQEQPLAKVRFMNAQQAAVDAIMAEQSEWPSGGGSLVQELPITVVAEIGQLWLSVEQLAVLQVGEVLQGESSFDGTVRLKANGHYLGSGQLIEVGDQWIIQIDHWFNQQPLAPPQAVAEKELTASRTASPKQVEGARVSAQKTPARDALQQEVAAISIAGPEAELEEAKHLAVEIAVEEAVLEEAKDSAVEALVEEALLEEGKHSMVEAAVEEAALEEAKDSAVEASVEEAVLEDATTVAMATDHEIGESGEEAGLVKKGEAMAVKAGIPLMISAQGNAAEQGEQTALAASQAMVAAVGGAAPAVAVGEAVNAPPQVRMPPKPPRPPKELRTAMNSMAKSVVGRRKPGSPSTA